RRSACDHHPGSYGDIADTSPCSDVQTVQCAGRVPILVEGAHHLSAQRIRYSIGTEPCGAPECYLSICPWSSRYCEWWSNTIARLEPALQIAQQHRLEAAILDIHL